MNRALIERYVCATTKMEQALATALIKTYDNPLYDEHLQFIEADALRLMRIPYTHEVMGFYSYNSRLSNTFVLKEGQDWCEATVNVYGGAVYSEKIHDGAISLFMIATQVGGF
jgi:hypothetical protein